MNSKIEGRGWRDWQWEIAKQMHGSLENVKADWFFLPFTLQRAEACLGRAQRLNPMVEIKCDTKPVMKKSHKYFEQFDVVILTGCVQEVMVRKAFKICGRNY